ncbi:MFS transporter [Streptomyces sp. DvalAA-21]|nr:MULTISPECIES: MFS transporter [unclassified Streptomyces]AEN08429.1 major facilitator superfamily MFS_1 [Streptomyces sp. SirexAA-E]PZX42772.1 MFS transporter [Streptomyces sp. DvalAA-21]RAJ39197.1 MFS transporter [Streptomyces sp. DpondAA-E10]RAJ53158.1 MFS transporter [Streptomyces sp. DpondAA-A50]SCD88901.1 Predicted arabinose efflux permease, MFS family [Streptomyces sp. BpilaLS-43]SCM13806.1 Predicted arabinose efflux permease, MFS family [Streptomyces sp. DpondAA-F4]
MLPFVPQLNKLRTVLPGGRDGDTAAPSSARLRIALTVFFALDGFVFAGWVVRIPAVKHQTGASASTLGLALLGVSAGAVITMMLTGRLCRRFGSPAVTVVCAVLLSLSISLPAQTHSALALGLVLLLFGVAYGGTNVAMNSLAVDLVAALRRPVMPSFHAAFSFGGMAGAGLGGLVAGSLSPATHLSLLAGTALLVTALTGPALLRNRHAAEPPARESVPASAPGAASAPASAPRIDGGARRTVVLFGVIALCTAYGEGALAEWGALHLTQDLHAGPGPAAAGYSLFALTMAIGRLSGTTLLERLGQTRTLVAGGATAAVGMLFGALAPTVWLALAGFALAGLGLANIFPVAVGRAGALTGPSGVAAASTLGYGGMLVGPPVIGFLADWLSLPVALTTVTLLAAVAAVLGYAARGATQPPAAE